MTVSQGLIKVTHELMLVTQSNDSKSCINEKNTCFNVSNAF